MYIVIISLEPSNVNLYDWWDRKYGNNRDKTLNRLGILQQIFLRSMLVMTYISLSNFGLLTKRGLSLPVISPVSWPGLIIALSNCGEDVDAKDIKMEIEMKFAPIFFPTPYAYLRVRIENKFFNFRLSLSKEEYNEIGKVFFSSDAATAGMEEPCFAIQKKFF